MPTKKEIDILLNDFRKKINLRYNTKTSRLMFFIMENLIDCMGEQIESEMEFVRQYKILYEYLEDEEKDKAGQIVEEILMRTKDEIYGKGTNKALKDLHKKILNTKTEIVREQKN